MRDVLETEHPNPVDTLAVLDRQRTLFPAWATDIVAQALHADARIVAAYAPAIRLGLEIERENVDWNSDCPDCEGSGEVYHHCDCDYCETSYVTCDKCGGSGQYDDDGDSLAPRGWDITDDGSLHDGAEFRTQDYVTWKLGDDAMPTLWERGKHIQNNIGDPHRRAGTHVHVSIPDIPFREMVQFGEPIMLKWRDHLRKSVNDVDPDRLENGYNALWDDDSIPESHCHDLVRSYHGSFEIRMFSSYQTIDQVWAALRPVLEDLSAAAARHIAQKEAVAA